MREPSLSHTTVDPERLSFSIEFEVETFECEKMTASPYWRLAAFFLRPLFLNVCLLVQISSGKLGSVAVRKSQVVSDMD